MGYLTQDLVAKSPVFLAKVRMATIKKIDAALASPDPKTVTMAKAVMQRVDFFVTDLAALLAIDALDLDSTELEIDTGITSHLDWLKAKTGSGA